ncbi:porin [Cupriavidus sp. D384]|uniref:porin n=1 Tax=Cupriavidus sp. D384 TaxID=1538095 RepID=UPI0009ED3A76|nr:porin [Cupriavidus sp. D384]
MRKQILVLSAAVITGTGHAQSSVTLYGVTDIGVEYVNNQPGSGSSAVRMQSGNFSGNRWGLRGVEDLGGGLAAVFGLESGFNLDDGKSAQGGRLFGRQAWAGLKSRVGTITFGRHSTPIYDIGVQYDPMIIAPRYSIGVQDPGFQSRADNSVKYTTSVGPLTGVGFYSFGVDGTAGVNGEVPGHSTIGREYSFSLQYSSGPLSVGTVYDEVAGSTLASMSDRTRRAAVVSTYDFGNTMAYLGYRYKWASVANVSNTGNLYWAGAKWRGSGAWTFTGATYYQDFHGTGADPWLFVLSGEYAFSKRTDVYVNVAYALNKSGSTLGVGGGDTVLAGRNQVGVVAAIRHKF